MRRLYSPTRPPVKSRSRSTADDRLTCAESVHRFLHHRRGGDGHTLQALEGKHAEYQEQFAQHQVELPEVFTRFGGDPGDISVDPVAVHEALKPGVHEVPRFSLHDDARSHTT